MKKALMILADGFEETEALAVADVLRRLEVEVVLAALDGMTVRGSHNIKVVADAALDEVADTVFDAVILPGGLPGADNLDADRRVEKLLKDHAAGGAVVAAICAAPFVLAKCGLLKDRCFTMYPGFDEKLGGLHYTDRPAEICGNIVTGKGPGAVFEFARALAQTLGLGVECEKLYKGMFIVK